MVDASCVSDLMIRQPTVAEPWQPVSFVRQLMLENSYSYIPVKDVSSGSNQWMLISEAGVAVYLRSSADNSIWTIGCSDMWNAPLTKLLDFSHESSEKTTRTLGIGETVGVRAVHEPLPISVNISFSGVTHYEQY